MSFFLNFKLSGMVSFNKCNTRRPFICERLKSGEVLANNVVQPLSFGDGTPCPNGYSTFGITTTGGSGTSEPCVFPFRYKGVLYNECITIDRNTPW